MATSPDAAKVDSASPLWEPSAPANTRTRAWIDHVNEVLDPGADLRTYEDLYLWSIGRRTPSSSAEAPDRTIETKSADKALISSYGSTSMKLFWSTVWEDTGVVGEKGINIDNLVDDHDASALYRDF
jgi:hypothetical protein